MRPGPHAIHAPPFPRPAEWVNVATLRMDQQRGRPVLIEFWDFCRVQSLRTLPYLKAWHERYATAGLRVISVHCPGFEPSRDPAAVRAAVARLGIEHPVLLDHEFRLWRDYDVEGWPSRYLWDPEQRLYEFHFGEGAYAETELAVQELLGVEREPVPPLRPEDDPAAEIVLPTPDRPGAWSGPYAAGGVWAVVSGRGTLTANRRTVEVEHPGVIALVEHPHHETGVLELAVGDGVTCHAVCFTPGVRRAG